MTEDRPLIFLDFDGVLLRWKLTGKNTVTYPTGFGALLEMDIPNFERPLVQNLEHILVCTNAQIVLSSSWRNYLTCAQAQGVLRYYGATSAEIIDATPPSWTGSTRAMCIKKWLSANRVPSRAWIAIDDDVTVKRLHRYVLTDPDHGLTRADAELAVQLLQGQMQ